jgi:hypothetical protein
MDPPYKLLTSEQFYQHEKGSFLPDDLLLEIQKLREVYS